MLVGPVTWRHHFPRAGATDQNLDFLVYEYDLLEYTTIKQKEEAHDTRRLTFHARLLHVFTFFPLFLSFHFSRNNIARTQQQTGHDSKTPKTPAAK